jgi:hypothetical protein
MKMPTEKLTSVFVLSEECMSDAQLVIDNTMQSVNELLIAAAAGGNKIDYNTSTEVVPESNSLHVRLILSKIT